MELNFSKIKLSPHLIIEFLRSRRTVISLAIFFLALIYGYFLLYSYDFQSLWFPQEDFKRTKTSLKKNLYNEIWEDFSARPIRLEEGMIKEYRNPFR